MATQVQFRRGTTTQNNAFTGAVGELTYDIDVKTLRIHDGATPGGGAIVLTTNAQQNVLNKTFSTNTLWNGTAIGVQYGGTGNSLTPTAGAIAYSGAVGLGLSAAGTSGQVLISGGTAAPTWVNSTSLQAGNSVSSTYATNVAGGSAGQLIIQQDSSLTTFITAGAAGTFLQSNGAGYAPGWAAGQVTFGSTTVALGATSTSISGLTAIDSTVGATSFFATPTTTTLFNSATSITVGATSGATLTLRPGTVVGANTTQALYNTVATTVNAFGAATTIALGASTGIATINNSQLVHASTNYTKIAVGTSAQRPGGSGGNPGTAAIGMIRYNSDISSYEGYASGNWSSLGGVKSVDAFTYIQAETSAGAGNGDLDFYAANAGKTAAVKAATLNYSRLSILATTASTSTTSGALQVAGGAGIAGALYVGGTVTISGNLSVSGTTTTTNSQSLTVTTPQLFLASDNAGNSTDVGLLGGYTSSGAKKMGLIKQASSNEWRLFSNGTGAPGTTYDFTGVTYDTLRLGSLIATANSSVTGTFSVSGATTLSSNATVGGTLGVTSNTTVGGTLGVTGTTTLAGLSASSLSISGNETVGGTLSVSGASNLNGGWSSGGASVNGSDAWLRTTGSTGWYNSTYAVGVYATDGSWVRTYNNPGMIASAFQISSDERIKDNIVDSKYGLAHILQLRSVEYDRKSNGKHDIGLIAQEVEKVIPEFVNTDEDEAGMKSVNYPQMVSVLIKAVQELSAEVNALKAKLGE